MASDPIADVSVVLLSKNEQPGLAPTLEKLADFADIVVDSNSEDRALEITKEHGARMINFAWDGKYSKKKQRSLEGSGARNQWVLLLDDEYPSPELIPRLAASRPSSRHRRM